MSSRRGLKTSPWLIFFSLQNRIGVFFVFVCYESKGKNLQKTVDSHRQIHNRRPFGWDREHCWRCLPDDEIPSANIFPKKLKKFASTEKKKKNQWPRVKPYWCSNKRYLSTLLEDPLNVTSWDNRRNGHSKCKEARGDIWHYYFPSWFQSAAEALRYLGYQVENIRDLHLVAHVLFIIDAEWIVFASSPAHFLEKKIAFFFSNAAPLAADNHQTGIGIGIGIYYCWIDDIVEKGQGRRRVFIEEKVRTHWDWFPPKQIIFPQSCLGQWGRMKYCAWHQSTDIHQRAYHRYCRCENGEICYRWQKNEKRAIAAFFFYQIEKRTPAHNKLRMLRPGNVPT